MTIYKAIIDILKRNYTTLLLGIVITGVITVFYSFQINGNDNDLEGAKIAIFDQDQSAVSQSLVDQLASQHERVTLEDSSQKGIDDALFFNEVEYVLTIPKNFGADLAAGKTATVDSQTRPGTFSKTLVNTTINHFLNTYQTFQNELTTLSQQEILNRTKETLAQEGTLDFDATYHQRRVQTLKGNIFNLLAYGLFMTIFSGYAVINLAFNRREIRERNSCSPVSRRKLSRRISVGSLAYSIACLALFLVFVVLASKSTMEAATGYFLLNAVIFFSTMVSFSVLVTSLIKSSEAVNGISNVFIMGSCFISGVFVPEDILPDAVDKIAAFCPTYWFVQNNELICKSTEINHAFQEAFFQQSLILIAFTAVFLVIHLISMREKGGLRHGVKKKRLCWSNKKLTSRARQPISQEAVTYLHGASATKLNEKKCRLGSCFLP